MTTTHHDGTDGPRPAAAPYPAPYGRLSAEEAERALRDALTSAGVCLPSLRVDDGGGFASPAVLVELGRARPDVVMRLAEVVRRGAEV